MFIFQNADQQPPRLGPLNETDNRLSVRMSAAVIAAFSALSWAVLIAIVVGTRAML